MSLGDLWAHSVLAGGAWRGLPTLPVPSPVPSTSSEDVNTIENHCDFSAMLSSFCQPLLPLYNRDLTSTIQLLVSLSQATPQPLPQASSPDDDIIDVVDDIDTLPKPIPLREVSQALLAAFNEEAQPIISRKRPSEKLDERKREKRRKEDKEDIETASPVSGMFIKEASALPPAEELQKEADLLDETAGYVTVSDESKKAIAAITNVIGDCVCSLCRVKYDDVFRLAQHKCPRIAHAEYRCADCEKTFSCPANLASHRRWHRPRDMPEYSTCSRCDLVFMTKKALRAHATACARNTPTISV